MNQHTLIAMKKPCKECPWVVKNKHNDNIIEFSKRIGKKHNCHMTNLGKQKLWEVDENFKCIGRELFINQ